MFVVCLPPLSEVFSPAEVLSLPYGPIHPWRIQNQKDFKLNKKNYTNCNRNNAYVMGLLR